MIHLTRIIFSVFFFIAALAASGQGKKGNEGYFITLQNDTVPCTFKDRNWKKQPGEFAVSVYNKDTVITPTGLKEVCHVSRQLIFASRTVSLAKYIDNIQNADSRFDPEFDLPRTVFVKLVYRGTMSLYSFLDKLGKNHFFIENADNFLELYLHHYTGTGGPLGDQPVAIQNKQYEFALKTLMTTCRTIFSIIESIGLNEEHLIRLLQIYEKCLESKQNE